MKKLTAEKLIQHFLAPLSPRQREVLESRYGLKTGSSMTLAEIGEKYGVTRERIRQIENLALQTVARQTPAKEAGIFFAEAVRHLEHLGGVRREDLLTADFVKFCSDANHKAFANRVKFLLEISGKGLYRQSDNDYHAFWHLRKENLDRVTGFVAELTVALESGAPGVAERVLAQPPAENYLSVSKKFARNGYGDFGLTDWPHINPKTARDWAYLVLKKNGKPLHFTALAKIINTLRKDKRANVQTVHNELIKDKRFVLVGRGVYGLQEFNLMAGTCREVIAKILKEHGPQPTKGVIKLVLAKRDFKENTLILNLQNKKHFTRLADGRYTTREV